MGKQEEEEESITLDLPKDCTHNWQEKEVLKAVPQEVLSILLSDTVCWGAGLIGPPHKQVGSITCHKRVYQGDVADNGPVGGGAVAEGPVHELQSHSASDCACCY